MIRLEPHGPVTRAEFTTARTRLVGISVSCYLVDGVVVDTAFPDVRRDFRAWLDECRPRGVFVTHQHEDHAGNVNSVVKRALPAWIAPETLSALRDVKPIGFYRHFTWAQMRVLTRDVVSFDPAPLVPIHLPGHSTDHHVAWHPEREILFSGDLFLGVKVRVAHANEQPRLLVQSLRTAVALRPRLVFDAHRGLVSEPLAALSAKADWLEHTIAEIDRLTDAGWSEAAIRRAVLGRDETADYFSFGDYSRANLVSSVQRTRPGATVAG